MSKKTKPTPESTRAFGAELTPAEPPPARARKLTSLADMQAVFEKSITIRINFDGGEFDVEAKRLTPVQSHKLEDMLAAATPPFIKGNPKLNEEDRYDVANPDYLKKKTMLGIQARAMGLYWSVPAIKDGFDAKANGGPAEVTAVTDFVQGLFNDQVLQLIWESVRDGGVRQVELVNFT